MTSFVIPQRDDDLLVPSATYYRVGTLLKDADQIESALIGSVLLHLLSVLRAY